MCTYVQLCTTVFASAAEALLVILFCPLFAVDYSIPVEVALGRKTGESRCLIDAAEREWTMALPDPVPLSLLDGCSCLQIKNASVGFAVGCSAEGGSSAAESAKVKSPTPAAAAPAVPVSGVKASAGAAVSSSLGTKKVRAVTAAAVTQPKVECTTILENITLDAHQKSKIAILGKNGCGKR